MAIQTCKTFGVIQYRDFNSDEAKKCKLYDSGIRTDFDRYQGSPFRSLLL